MRTPDSTQACRSPQARPRRVEHRAAVGVPDAAQVRRRVKLGADRAGVEQRGFARHTPPRRRPPRPGRRAATARWRRRGRRCARSRSRCRGTRTVASISSRFAWPSRTSAGISAWNLAIPVGDPVGEAGRAEAAVAPGRGPADAARLQQRDIGRRVALLAMQRGPQAGEPAADHRQPGSRAAGQPRRWPGARPPGPASTDSGLQSASAAAAHPAAARPARWMSVSRHDKPSRPREASQGPEDVTSELVAKLTRYCGIS